MTKPAGIVPKYFHPNPTARMAAAAGSSVLALTAQRKRRKWKEDFVSGTDCLLCNTFWVRWGC